ncbi:MAG: DUF1836 domain-containing protein [Eubacteriales bacterium]|nr:DUF1836 domain-containing protein [Eubacteriales bacterium]
MDSNIEHFHLPTYREIPTVGLYLEQTVKYINECLHPLGCIEITSSMVSNYIKKGYAPRPVKKQYNADLIAHLLFISVAKQVLSMENVVKLLDCQKQHYSVEEAYDYFCREFERVLRKVFDLSATAKEIAPDAPIEIRMLRSVVIAVSHIIYLSHCFNEIDFRNTEEGTHE